MNRAAPTQHEILAATLFGQGKATNDLFRLLLADKDPAIRRRAGIALGLRHPVHAWWRPCSYKAA